MNNGRIDINNYEGGTPFFLKEKIRNDDKTNYANAIKYTLHETKLSQTFFTKENIQILQNGIRSGVHKMSNSHYIIDEQDEDTLKIIMRSIYLQNAKHKDDYIKEQISDLNKLVLDYCIPRVFNEVKGYMRFKEDTSTLAMPMDRPIQHYNDKSLKLNNFF